MHGGRWLLVWTLVVAPPALARGHDPAAGEAGGERAASGARTSGEGSSSAAAGGREAGMSPSELRDRHDRQAAGRGAVVGADEREQDAAELRSVVGKVERIEGDTLTLRNRLDERHAFALSDETRFLREGKPLRRDELKEGDEVRASFLGTEGNLQATTIRVLSSGASQGSGSGAEADEGQGARGGTVGDFSDTGATEGSPSEPREGDERR